MSPAPNLVGMPKSAAYDFELGGDERAELEHRAACSTLSFRQVRRARLVLAKITEGEPRLALRRNGPRSRGRSRLKGAARGR